MVPDRDAGVAGAIGQGAGMSPAIDDRRDLEPGRLRVERGPVGVVVVGRDHHAPAGRHAVAVQVGAHGGRQHDPGTIVAREHQRSLQRPGREHGLPRPNCPEALARRMVARRQVIGDALEGAQDIVVVVPEHTGATKDADFRQGSQSPGGARDPVCRCRAADDAALPGKRAAEVGSFIGQEHAGAALAGGARGREPGGAGADHEHVAMQMAVLVSVGIRRARGPTQPGRAADQTLVDRLPKGGRPHEGLVIEAGRQNRRQQRVERHDIKTQAGPAILARGDQAVVELDLGGERVRLQTRASAELDQGVGLVGAGGDDAARPVVLEAATQQAHAVREQRRGERVAGMALQGAAVEAKGQRLRAVDQAALPQAHGLSAHSAGGSRRSVAVPVAAISWVAV